MHSRRPLITTLRLLSLLCRLQLRRQEEQRPLDLIPRMEISELSHTLETGSDIDGRVPCQQPKRRAISAKQSFLYLILGLLALSLAMSFIYSHPSQMSFPLRYFYRPSNASLRCLDPATRQEWRNFSESEKMGYLRAVKCLKSKPSRVRREGSLYDDFPFVHNLIGGYCMRYARFH